MVLRIGREDQGLYILRNGSIPTRSVNRCANNVQLLSDSSVLWHKRMGHALVEVLKRHAALSHLKYEDHECIVCPLAKLTKLSFQPSISRSKDPFSLLHCDIWGPYRVPTYNNKRFFVTIVDDYSGFTWLFLIQFKSEVIVVLRDFLTRIQNLFSTSVKVLRTDNGCEFFSHEFKSLMSTLGILHQTSCVYTPQQNGVVEA